MVNPGQQILALQHGIPNPADTGEHRGCCGSGAYPGLLSPFTPPLESSFFRLKIRDSKALTGCSWDTCMHPLNLWSPSEWGLWFAFGDWWGIFPNVFFGQPEKPQWKDWVQALPQSGLFTRAALACFVLTNLSFSKSDFWLGDFSKTTESFLRGVGRVFIIPRDGYMMHHVYWVHV